MAVFYASGRHNRGDCCHHGNAWNQSGNESTNWQLGTGNCSLNTGH